MSSSEKRTVFPLLYRYIGKKGTTNLLPRLCCPFLLYMASMAVDVQWVQRQFPDVIVASYDQMHPSDAMGRVMTDAFSRFNSPLLGAEDNADTEAMKQRMIQCGFEPGLTESFDKNQVSTGLFRRLVVD
eukprot:gene23275-9579_t